MIEDIFNCEMETLSNQISSEDQDEFYNWLNGLEPIDNYIYYIESGYYD